MADLSDPCKEARERYEHAWQEVAKYLDSPDYNKGKCDSLHDRAFEKLQIYIQCLRYHGLKTSVPLWVPACPYPESFIVHEEAGEPISGEEYLELIPDATTDGFPVILVLGAIVVVVVLFFAFKG